MFSYAGIPLAEPLASDVGSWIEANIEPARLFPLANQSWANQIADGPLMDITPEVLRPVRLNSLYWPVGARHFARAHFVVTDDMLTAIRGAVQTSGGNSLQTGLLVMDDGTNNIQTKMYMLPAWPLQQVGLGANIWLLTLVDERYWWWGVPLSITSYSTWKDLYTSIGTALGITITPDTVNANYSTPPTSLYNANYVPLPAYFDLVAFSIGQRVVRKLDGTVITQNATTALSSVNSQLPTITKPYAGGALPLTGPVTDLASLVPKQITVVFPAVGDSPPASGYYTVAETLTSLAITQYGGVIGAPFIKKLHRLEQATYASGVIQNSAALGSVAQQFAQDWYTWQLARLDQQVAGILPWTAEGMHNLEYEQRGKITTRIQRGVYDPIEDLLPQTFSSAIGNTTIKNSTTWTLSAQFKITSTGPLVIDVTTFTLNSPTVNIGNSGVWTFDSTTNIIFNGKIKLCGTWIINDSANVVLTGDTPALALPAKPRQPIDWAGFNLQGMVAPTLAAGDRMRVILINNGSAGYIKHEDAAAAAANRFTIPGGQHLQVQANDAVQCDYDPNSNRWIVATSTPNILRAIQTVTSAADLNDFALTIGAEWLQVTPTANINLTGMKTGITDRPIRITNVGTSTLTIKNQSVSSGAANRFQTNTGRAIILTNNQSVWVYYDGPNTEWRDICGTSPSEISPLTTKGDVWIFDTADNRLPVGTDTQVLTADSTQAAGLKWATPSSGGSDTTLFDHFADAGNVSTPETDLYSDTLAAGQFATNGDKVIIWYGISTANNGNMKAVRAYVAGTKVLDSGTVSGLLDVIVFVKVIRVSASVLRVIASMEDASSPNSKTTFTEITGLTLANTQIVKVTGQGNATNDVVAKCGSVGFVKHA